MAKIAESKTEIVYTGPFAEELTSFAAPGSWTNEKSDAFLTLMEGLNAAGYRNFSSSVNTIGLQRKGQSATYLVPVGQRGALAAFSGKHVHIVCVDRTDDYSGRIFAFSEVSNMGRPIHDDYKGEK
jgi:hypothetical protein